MEKLNMNIFTDTGFISDYIKSGTFGKIVYNDIGRT